jgi:ABC-type multidrug transport system fused ATPase/permease subunit
MNFTLKYRPNLPAVLKNLNLTVKQGEKLGVVGRTGAGKSTIIASILRLVEPTEGTIYIDDMNILEIPVNALRSSITLIPQDPMLIEGTLRDNLDPTNEHTEEELAMVLRKCCLDTIFAEREQLNTRISDAGENLSVGEKQLVCISRAILRNSRLILIDEATANIDVKADQLIQKTIRECFREATVITIAHRINTVIDSDRVLVMDAGKVVEIGEPAELLAKKGEFYRLYNQAEINHSDR